MADRAVGCARGCSATAAAALDLFGLPLNKGAILTGRAFLLSPASLDVKLPPPNRPLCRRGMLQQFAEQWINRPGFKAVYDNVSNADFVNALYTNADLLPSQSKFASLVAGLDSSGQSRSAVLLEVAADATFRQKKRSAAVVMMQYFGYLRRNPNAAPEIDLSGYLFWLNKLNTFNGDFQQAEMVRAFITSPEYRGRFGQ